MHAGTKWGWVSSGSSTIGAICNIQEPQVVPKTDIPRFGGRSIATRPPSALFHYSLIQDRGPYKPIVISDEEEVSTESHYSHNPKGKSYHSLCHGLHGPKFWVSSNICLLSRKLLEIYLCNAGGPFFTNRFVNF